MRYTRRSAFAAATHRRREQRSRAEARVAVPARRFHRRRLAQLVQEALQRRGARAPRRQIGHVVRLCGERVERCAVRRAAAGAGDVARNALRRQQGARPVALGAEGVGVAAAGRVHQSSQRSAEQLSLSNDSQNALRWAHGVAGAACRAQAQQQHAQGAAAPGTGAHGLRRRRRKRGAPHICSPLLRDAAGNCVRAMALVTAVAMQAASVPQLARRPLARRAASQAPRRACVVRSAVNKREEAAPLAPAPRNAALAAATALFSATAAAAHAAAETVRRCICAQVHRELACAQPSCQT